MRKTIRWGVLWAALVLVLYLITSAVTRPPSSSTSNETSAQEPHGEPVDRQRVATKSAAVSEPTTPAALRVEVDVVPPDARCNWRVEVHVGEEEPLVRSGEGPGSAEFGGIVRSRVFVRVSAPGFIGQQRMWDVVPGEEVVQAVSLLGLAGLSGSVEAEGRPLAGALVQVAIAHTGRSRLGRFVDQDTPGLTPARAVTDDGGSFEIAGLAPSDEYVIEVRQRDFGPVRLGGESLSPAEQRHMEFTLLRGAYFSGRVVDHQGAPLRGGVISILVPDAAMGPNVLTIDSTTRVGRDGRFRTAPFAAGQPAWLVVNEVMGDLFVVIDRSFPDVPPGEHDLGDLAPHPGVVTFSFPELEYPTQHTLVVTSEAAVGRRAFTAGPAPFSSEGTLRVVGLDGGNVRYSVRRAKSERVAEGEFIHDGTDRSILIERLSKPVPESGLVVVHAQVPPGADGRVLATRGGSVVMDRVLDPDEGAAGIDLALDPGTYRVYLISGGSVGWSDVTVEHDRTSTTILTASTVGDEVHATVLRDGVPVSGAEVELRGLADRRGSSLVRVARSGEDGRFVLRGMPPGVPGVALAVLDRGTYHRVYIPRERFDDARIDFDHGGLLSR